MSALSVGVMIFASLWTLGFVMGGSAIWFGLLWLCPLFGAVVTGLHYGRKYYRRNDPPPTNAT